MKFKNIFPKLKYFFLIIILQIFPICCEKESCDVVPDTYINITLEPILLALSPTQSAVITNIYAGQPSLGYDNNGIIIYCNSPEEYFSYDRTCPYHVEESIPVDAVNNGMYAVCPVCSSEYQLWFSGFPTDGSVSQCPLKQYKTSYNPNFNTINIYN